MFAVRHFANRGESLIIHSGNLGRTWVEAPIDFKHRITVLQVMDGSEGGMLGGTGGGGLYERDHNHGWIEANHGFQEGPATSLTAAGETLYALEGTAFLYRSTDQDWKNLSSRIPSGSFRNVAVDPNDSQHILLAGDGLWFSQNGGQTWTPSTFHPPVHINFNLITFDPLQIGRVYVTRDRKIYKSEDGGETFDVLPGELPAEPSRMIVDSNKRDVLYFVVPYFGIWKSTDGGSTISAANSGIAHPCAGCASITTVDLLPLQHIDTYLVITSGAGRAGPLYRTSDGAQQWELVAQAPTANVESMSAMDAKGKHLFVTASYGSHLFESTDSGANWVNTSKEFERDTKFRGFLRANRFFLLTDHGIFAQ